MKTHVIKFQTTLMIVVALITNSCGENNSDFRNNLVWNYEYYEDGQIKTITDPGGKESEYNYQYFQDDQKGVSEIQKSTVDGQIKYIFNKNSELSGIAYNSGFEEFEYDNTGQLKSIKRSDGETLAYSYSQTGKITSMSLSSGYTLEYVYDFLDRLIKMKTPSGDITYKYLNGGEIVERQLPNGIKTQLEYAGGKLEAITHVGNDNFVIEKYSYDYNADGLITSIVEQSARGKCKLLYEYDEMQRLIAFVDKNNIKIEYKYDPFGNRTAVVTSGINTENCTYDGLSRMKSINGKTCDYDGSGNLLSIRDEGIEFDYNSSNQLKKAKDVSFEYNGNGLLISRSSENQKTEFINNPISATWQPLSISSENEKKFFIWEGDNPVAIIENGQAIFLLTDYLGSVRGITDENGNLTKELNYDPFGVPRNEILDNTFMPGFAGLFYVPEAKIYLTKSRAYSPYMGRFLQIDPLHQIPNGSQKDLSVFAYCGGDPVNYMDKSGAQTINSEIENYQNNILSRNSYLQNYHNYGIFSFEENIWNNSKYSTPEYKEYVKDVNIPGYGSVDMNWRNISRVSPYPSIIGGFLISSAYHPIEFIPKIVEAAKTKSWKPVQDQFENIGKNYRGMAWGAMDLHIDKSIPRSWKWIGNYKEGNKRGNVYGDNFKRNINNWILKPSSNILKNMNNILKDLNYQHNPFVVKEAWGDEINLPSNVGGVYLGGAGAVFEGLGQLSGIAVDENTGKLILISEDKGHLDISQLRVEDVVTVFRSIYHYGELYCSIDPDPQDPHGQLMKTRHGEASKNSYVGWVLYESDRIMKGFSLGEDNITKKPIQTEIEGYSNMLQAMFLLENSEETWERFWIVPSKVEKNISSKSDLTLLEVPLIVKTQKMILHEGKLQPSPDGKISKACHQVMVVVFPHVKSSFEFLQLVVLQEESGHFWKKYFFQLLKELSRSAPMSLLNFLIKTLLEAYYYNLQSLSESVSL